MTRKNYGGVRVRQKPSKDGERDSSKGPWGERARGLKVCMEEMPQLGLGALGDLQPACRWKLEQGHLREGREGKRAQFAVTEAGENKPETK